jgi:NADH-quinone oxidoreductase subunit D
VSSGRRLVLGIGQAAHGSEQVDVVLDLGPQHPTSHGLLTLTVAVDDDDRITQADLGAAYLHRGAEKLFEVRDYRQIMVLANRHDWLSAFSGELGVALAVERQLGLEVPARATWIRTALAELGRALHHLAFLAPLTGYAAEPESLASSIDASRSATLETMEAATGGRLHVMATRIGGLRRDVPTTWTSQARDTATSIRAAHDALVAAFASDNALVDRFTGLGTVDPATVDAYGLSGVLARAAGVDLDLRRDAPYLAYDALADELVVPLGTDGDALTRLRLLVAQLAVSARLVECAADQIDQLRGEPVDVLLPKVLRVPEGTSTAAVEAPGGISGYVLVSRGDKVPWRLKLRSASFSNASVMPELLVGASVGDVVPILQSLQLITGDLSK